MSLPSAKQIKEMAMLSAEMLDFCDWLAGNQKEKALEPETHWSLVEGRAQAIVAAAIVMKQTHEEEGQVFEGQA